MNVCVLVDTVFVMQLEEWFGQVPTHGWYYRNTCCGGGYFRIGSWYIFL